MKRIVIAIFATIMLALPSSAQVKFGFQGGFNINKFIMDTAVIESSNQAGFYIGPTFLISLANFDIEASGIYDLRNIEVDGETMTRQNLDIQANIRKALHINDNFSIFAFAGPQYAFNLGVKNFDEVTDYVKDWRWKDSDFSVNLGGGIKINNIEIRVNYNTALGKTAEASEIISNYKEDIEDNGLFATREYKLKPKANAWQIGATYYF